MWNHCDDDEIKWEKENRENDNDDDEACSAAFYWAFTSPEG